MSDTSVPIILTLYTISRIYALLCNTPGPNLGQRGVESVHVWCVILTLNTHIHVQYVLLAVM